MALVATIKKRSRSGSQHKVVVDIAFDSSYPTGGEALTASNVALSVIEDWNIPPNSGYLFNYDATNSKVLAYASGGVAAHSHDLLVKGAAAAGIDEPVGVEGGTSLAKDAATDRTITGADSATLGGVLANTAIATGAAAQIANATNLAALTAVRATFWGH